MRTDAEFIDANLPAPRRFAVVVASEVIEHFLDPLCSIFGRHSGKLPVVLQQFARGEIVVEIRLFRKEANLRLDFGISPVLTQDSRCAGGRGDQPHEHL